MKNIFVFLAFLATLMWQPVTFAEESQSNIQSRAQIHTELGAAYFTRGQLGVALEELKEAIKSDPRYAPAYNMLGLVYLELREFPQAEENFQRAFRLDENNPEFHNNYGWFLCQDGRPDEGIKHFFAALKNPLYSTPGKAYLNAGVCSIMKGDERGAENFFLKALKLQPQQQQVLYYLAEIAYRRKEYLDAKDYINRNMQVSQPGPEVLWLALRTERKLGNRDAEANLGMQLRKNFPDSREVLALRNGQYEYTEFAKLEKVAK